MKNNSIDSQAGEGSNLVLSHSFPGTGVPIPLVPTVDHEAASPNYLRIVHSALRGRYWLVGALSLLSAGVAGYLGWRHAKPLYTSEGLVQIHYYTRMPVNANSASEPLQMFDQYMAQQKTLITSRQVIDMAMEEPIWKEKKVTPPSNPQAYFADHLQVEVKAKSELIHLTVGDSDPVATAAAVTAVIDAYNKYYDSQEAKKLEEPINHLEKQLADLDQQIAAKRGQIHDLAMKHLGQTRVDILLESAQLNYRKLNDAVNEVDEALAGIQQDGTAGKAPAVEAPSASFLVTPDQIAASEPRLQALLTNKEKIEGQLAGNTTMGPAASSIMALKAVLAQTNTAIDEFVATWRAIHPSGLAAGDPNRQIAAMSTPALKAKREELKKLRDSAQDELTDLGRAKLEFQEMDTELTSLTVDQGKVTTRLGVLRDESSQSSKLEVISHGEVPISASKDARPKLAMAAGGMGALLPLGISILLYMLVRRYRYADETVSDSILANVPMLGLLPDVRSKREVPELMRAMAHGIHHLRVLLCARRSSSQAFLVTSAAEGEGKTSLAVALGMSFAATRRKTLLIDGDFVGQRVTHGFGMEKHEGMFEALSDGQVASRIRTVSPNLDVLPAGKAGTVAAFGVTNESIHAVIEAARKLYDTIVVDSGPILGSLEASMLAPEVDSVILTISRGQQHGLLESAMRRLHSLSAEIAGVVFNRALLKDFHGSTYASTAMSTPSVEHVAPAESVHTFDRFGPVVRAVAQTTSAAA